MSYDYLAEIKKFAEDVIEVVEYGLEQTVEEIKERCANPLARERVWGGARVWNALEELQKQGRVYSRSRGRGGEKRTYWSRTRSRRLIENVR